MFEQNGYQIIQNAISEETAKLLEHEFTILVNAIKYMNPEYTGSDGQVEKAFSYYASFGFEALLLMMLPKVEEVVGCSLYPTYSYARMYYNDAVMEKHLDRPSCQYSATMNISIDESGPWGIWFKDLNGGKKEIILNPGDMCVYKGTDLEHWRTEYKGEKQIQVFLHYVDMFGQHAFEKFDKRRMLGLPNVN